MRRAVHQLQFAGGRVHDAIADFTAFLPMNWLARFSSTWSVASPTVKCRSKRFPRSSKKFPRHSEISATLRRDRPLSPRRTSPPICIPGRTSIGYPTRWWCGPEMILCAVCSRPRLATSGGRITATAPATTTNVALRWHVGPGSGPAKSLSLLKRLTSWHRWPRLQAAQCRRESMEKSCQR